MGLRPRTLRSSGQAEDGAIWIGDDRIPVTAERDPANLKWGDLGAEIVLECTGLFRTKAKAQPHIDAGAKRVIISAPGKEIDGTFVVGINSDQFDPSVHEVISCASCTTNCLAPLAKVLNDTYGILKGHMVTVHSYTNDQRILDLPHSDMRRARAAAVSMIPTSTGAATAIGLVLPELKGKLDGTAIRVPTPNVSMTCLTAHVGKQTDRDAVNAAMKAAADGPLKGVSTWKSGRWCRPTSWATPTRPSSTPRRPRSSAETSSRSRAGTTTNGASRTGCST